MKIFMKIATTLFPKASAIPSLQGLPPSWSGLFRRIVFPPRFVQSQFGTYEVTVLSRDESQRVTDHNFKQVLTQYRGAYQDVVILDDYDSEATKKRVETIVKNMSENTNSCLTLPPT